eukprot:CAMPEP_0178980578 /NCGR_PEP_ID=MMETSP0789-20121207/26574_1 /TAXON_ID=3005 /ORGANISM="Rhizosolenia setigera, Strain CCMP 1694" /LENGTH=303 /DNA_ID=CAMNT_0020671007 /DNA_START=322 /DNA_END=1229 /DNA_ORIENTATION=-
MGMNDTETVALIGGGHAFGKAHGACDSPPCGTGDMQGKGPNTFTSGFEGAWTQIPTTWSNLFFTNLFEFEWDLIEGPVNAPDIFMLTSDLALRHDEKYRAISESYKNDLSYLDEQFMHSWYKLTTQDMGPLGDGVPPAQAFQSPLPAATSSELPDFIPVRAKLQSLIDEKPQYRALFVDLSHNNFGCCCTDYDGGCNGSFIRFEEEHKESMDILEKVKVNNPEASYADIIVLAGQVALEDAGSDPIAFCGGRVDALEKTDLLEPVVYDTRIDTTSIVKDRMAVKGLTPHQGVALEGKPTGSQA